MPRKIMDTNIFTATKFILLWTNLATECSTHAKHNRNAWQNSSG